MTIRLRPHHLLCLQTYAGKGYTPAFTANYDLIAARLSNGEDIEIVEGPDDICTPLLTETDPHCWRDSVTQRDQQASTDLQPLLKATNTGTKLTLTAPLLEKMRASFRAGPLRPACTGCEWSDLCTRIADTDFEGTRVQIAAP